MRKKYLMERKKKEKAVDTIKEKEKPTKGGNQL